MANVVNDIQKTTKILQKRMLTDTLDIADDVMAKVAK
jgi:hypothetical protein